MEEGIAGVSGSAEHRYRVLVENSLGLMCVHDLRGLLVYVSPPAAQALGRTVEDMIGRSLRGYLVPSVEHLFDGYLDRIRKEGADSGLMLLQAKDGTEQIWQYRNVVAAPPGLPPQVYGHAIDVTERVRAEQALRQAQRALEESQARHQSLVEGSTLGVCIHQDGVIRFANRTLAQMHGCEAPDELVGQPFVTLHAPSERARLEEHAAALLRGERVPERLEVEHATRTGRTLWAETWSSVVLWNQALAVLVTVVDVSERKRLEARVRQMEKMEAVARLAGGVAQECNNLMTVVLGRGELLHQSLDAGDARRGGVEMLIRAAGRVAVLAQQLLAFSRRLTLRMEPLDLGEVIAGLAPRIHTLLPVSASLDCVAGAGLWLVDADRSQIEEAIIRLAANACDAMPRGGRLRLEAANVLLDEAFVQKHAGARSGPHVVVSVQDTGLGISPEVLAHLFEPFFTTKGVGEGSGLGLPSVYGIVKQHGGYVEVESTPGAGTTVRMYFPRPAPGADPPTAGAPFA